MRSIKVGGEYSSGQNHLLVGE